MTKIKIKDIMITGENPRKHFDEDKLRELGESIKVQGLLQPIIVRPREGRYELVVGERRFKACQLAGIPEIEADVRDIDDLTCADLRLIENLHREDLTPSEKDQAIAQHLMSIARESDYDLSDNKQYHQLTREASERTKLKKKIFDDRLRTMELLEILENAGVRLPHSTVEVIMRYPSLGVPKQIRIARLVQRENLSIPKTRECLKEIYRNPDKDIETLVKKMFTSWEEKKREEKALKEKRKKEKARKPKKKSGRPRKKIKPNEFLEKLAAKKRKKIEEIGEKAKEKAIKREINALKKKRAELPAPVRIEGVPETWHKIIIRDSRKMTELRDGSVHLVITSPPYFNAPFDYRDFFESYDDGESSFLSLIEKSAEEIYRVLGEGRIACINCDDMLVEGKKYPIVADVTRIFREKGFKYRDRLVWRKPEGYIRTTRRSGIILQHPYPMYYYPDNIQESVLIFQKGDFDHKGIEKKIRELSRIDVKEFQGGKWNLSVWDIMNVPPAQSKLEKSIAAFPEELVYRLIKLFSHVGETVLDPFLGSGTTARVAYELGRNSVGYEKDRKLLRKIKEKVGITKENKPQFEILETIGSVMGEAFDKILPIPKTPRVYRHVKQS